MQQLNQSPPDAQSVHIVTMEVGCDTHTRRREAGHTIRQSIGLKCMSIKINCLIDSEHTTQYTVQMVCALLTKLQDRCISQFGGIN